MTYDEIDQYMQATGLASDPAFDNLHFYMTDSIQPRHGKNILGLFYPDGEAARSEFGPLPPSTIVLPLNSSEGTLLHELGHRHGVYYYNDISEGYAEQYRKARVGKMLPKYTGVTRVAELAEARKVPSYSQGWAVNGFQFNNPPASLLAGAPISLSIGGQVTDRGANFPDAWQIVVWVPLTRPDGSLGGDFVQLPSSNFGIFPYDTTIRILGPGGGTLVLQPGVMPNHNLSIAAFIFANQDDRPTFNPMDAASNGFVYVTNIATTILLNTAGGGGGGGGGSGTANLTIVVQDSNGVAIPGATVSIDNGPAMAAPTTSAVTVGTHTVSAGASGYNTNTQKVTVPSTGLNIRMQLSKGGISTGWIIGGAAALATLIAIATSRGGNK